jgi:LysR family transcriptional regulator, glycine cleavage system transcriptional activator
MVFRLPPLNTLRLFDAAARCGSFKKAADELHLTASAVSHGIQTLEDAIGTELFRRNGRAIALTPAGMEYHPVVNGALVALAEATERLPGRKATGTLSVSSAPTFANRWLLPRLSRFAEQHPDISVSIDTSQKVMDLPLDGVDVAIRMARDAKSAPNWTRLVEETFVPVCSPKFKRRHKGREIERGPFIHVTLVPTDWREWFGAAGIEPPAATASDLRVDTIQMGLDAAVAGLGVVLGRTPLVNADRRRRAPCSGLAVQRSQWG